ncbi:hypothetical protein IFR05_009557 [Cadophora sp. M221]|nr:hypothetical protein IFR05_009557 [Cadophora sp. M221]
MERSLNHTTTVTACHITPGSEKQGPASFGFRLSSQHMGVDLNKESEWLKERSKEDKRLKEKFPKINGMRTNLASSPYRGPPGGVRMVGSTRFRFLRNVNTVSTPASSVPT